jgi:hypothetical protein
MRSACSRVTLLDIGVSFIAFSFDRPAPLSGLVGLHGRDLVERPTFETSDLLQCGLVGRAWILEAARTLAKEDGVTRFFTLSMTCVKFGLGQKRLCVPNFS